MNQLTRQFSLSVLLALSAITAITLACTGCGGHGCSPGIAVPGAAFTLSVSPASRSVTQGQTADYTITATSSGGFASPVAFAVSGLPAGATADYNPPSIMPTPGGSHDTVTITTAGGANPTPAGTYTLTFTGAGGGIQRQTSLTLVVTAVPPQTGGLNGTIQ